VRPIAELLYEMIMSDCFPSLDARNKEEERSHSIIHVNGASTSSIVLVRPSQDLGIVINSHRTVARPRPELIDERQPRPVRFDPGEERAGCSDQEVGHRSEDLE
jgi:hypothetical protein